MMPPPPDTAPSALELILAVALDKDNPPSVADFMQLGATLRAGSSEPRSENGSVPGYVLTAGPLEFSADQPALFAGPGIPSDDSGQDGTISGTGFHIAHLATQVAAAYNAEIMAKRLQLTPQQFGTALHTRIAAALKEEDLPGVQVEQSWARGEDKKYGEAGTVRTDVTLKDAKGDIIAIWDFKTGVSASMPERRQKALRSAVRADHAVA